MLPLSPTNASFEQVLHDAGIGRLLLNSLQESLYLSYPVIYSDPHQHPIGSRLILRASPGQCQIQHRCNTESQLPPRTVRCEILLHLGFCRTPVPHIKPSPSLYDNHGQYTEPIWWADSRWKSDSQ